jgi:hypothetical protein
MRFGFDPIHSAIVIVEPHVVTLRAVVKLGENRQVLASFDGVIVRPGTGAYDFLQGRIGGNCRRHPGQDVRVVPNMQIFMIGPHTAGTG